MLENESGASEVVELRLRVRELEQQLQTARMVADRANAELAALRSAIAAGSPDKETSEG